MPRLPAPKEEIEMKYCDDCRYAKRDCRLMRAGHCPFWKANRRMKVEMVIFLILFCLSMVAMLIYYAPTPTAPVVHQDGLMGDDGHQRVPTMRDVQEGLLDAGCDIGTDGVDGAIGPNTIGAWEAYDCNKMALRINGPRYKETK